MYLWDLFRLNHTTKQNADVTEFFWDMFKPVMEPQ